MIRSTLFTVLFCFTSILVQGQQALEGKKNNNKIWELSERFKSTDVPEKWKNESAVILYQDQRFAYTIRSTIFFYEEIIRKRIKLLDQASIDEYSKFYYTKSNPSNYGDDFYIGLKIIKSDGKEVIIDVDKESIEEAIEEKKSTMYSSYYSSKKYYKLAVPNLQIGDVIDYYIERKFAPTYYNRTHKFLDTIFSLNELYPIKSQRYSFTIGKDLYFNFNSYNGAQKLKETDLSKEHQDDSHFKGAKCYFIEDFDREKRKAKYFSMPYRTEPCIKFQIQYIPFTKRYYTPEFIGDKGIPRSNGPTAEELANAFVNSTQNIIKEYKRIVKKIRKLNKGVTDPFDIARLSYYYYYDLNIPKKKHFHEILVKVLDQFEINYDIIAVGSKKRGNVSDILFLSEVNWIIKVNDGKNSIYLHNNGQSSDFEDIPASLQGVDGLLFDPYQATSEIKLSNVRIPENDCSRNVFTTITKVNINDDEKISLDVEKIAKGLFRKQISHEYYYSRIKNYFQIKSELTSEEMKKELTKSLVELSQKGYDSQLEIKDYILKEHSITYPTVTNNEYLKFSREAHEFKVNEKYNLDGAIIKAGPSIILKVGLLIGEQITLDNKDRIRNEDAFIDMRKTYKNTVEINIPSGYSVGNLDDFNVKVDNQVSSFNASATIQDGKVVITTEKKYKESKVSIADWPKLMTMLDAAAGFTQKKLLLKKEI